MAAISFRDALENRYDRQKLITWWDQARLAQAQVIVAGAGALGNEVLKLLGLMGVGKITVIDFDTVSASNLARMVLFREQDIGLPKVLVAAERLRELNPQVEVRPVQADLRFEPGLGEYRQADVVFGCLDSVNARWALNRRCYQAGVTWIDGGISDFHGQVTRYTPGQGACYECTFTPATYERFNRRYSCPYGLVQSGPERKTPTTAITTSLTAALQVQEALYLLHDHTGGLQPGERLSLFLDPYHLTRDRLPENPDCLAHETLPEVIPALALPSLNTTAREAIHQARSFLPGARALELPYDLVEGFSCPACGNIEEVLRPKEQVRHDEARCPDCGELRQPEIVSVIDEDMLLSRVPLGRIGLVNHEVLAFWDADQFLYLQVEANDRTNSHSKPQDGMTHG